MVRNVVANPAIRHLILCGRDSRGHRAGQAIIALKEDGVDASNRIVGAKGPRPSLKNLSLDEIGAFRGGVTVVDEIDTKDPKRIAEVARHLGALPSGEAVRVAPRVHQVKTVEAQTLSNRDWVADPEGYFVLLLDRDEKALVCEHYTVDGTLNEVIRGAHAGEIANTAIRRGLLSRLDHAAYLGRELARAEIALQRDAPYVQD